MSVMESTWTSGTGEPGSLASEPGAAGRCDRARRFLEEARPATPCLVIDLAEVEQNYLRLDRALPAIGKYYAVKACPEPAVVKALAALGSSFDVASLPEVELALACGVDPDRLSFGNTVKKERDIAAAFELGVRLFAVDSLEEVLKVARAAPSASVYCRLLNDGRGAEYPLSRKFGCDPVMALDVLVLAAEVGLDVAGVSFHCGSQQLDPHGWDRPIAQAAALFTELRALGLSPWLLNVGGGFPARYTTEVPPLDVFGDAIRAAIDASFGDHKPIVICEPGRAIAGGAGVLRTEVVLVSRKSYDDDHRWVYLDIGRFGGLAETEGEVIRYPLVERESSADREPVVLAGPTCDSVDVLYERERYELSSDLKAGDTVDLLCSGAYTSSYSSVAFNGFAPLATYCI